MTKFSRGNIRAGKLTPTEVYELREAYAQGATQGQLSRRYSISIGQVGRIVRGEVWQQYTNPAAEPTPVRPRLSSDDLAREAAESEERLKASLSLTTISDSKADLEQDLPPERREAILRRLQSDAKTANKPLDDLQQFTEEK